MEIYRGSENNIRHWGMVALKICYFLIYWHHRIRKDLNQDCRIYVSVLAVVIPVPVGQSHHDVKRGQEEHEVEERVAVRDAILLVVHGPVWPVSLVEILRRWTVLDQSGLVASQR